jgi:hypothetical protein
LRKFYNQNLIYGTYKVLCQIFGKVTIFFGCVHVIFHHVVVATQQRGDRLQLYLKLCNEQGIISSDNDLLDDEFYQSQIDAIYANADVQALVNRISQKAVMGDSDELVTPDSEGLVSPILVVMIVIAIGVAVFAAIGFWVGVGARFVGPNKSGSLITNPFSDDDLNSIDIYTLKEGSREAYIAVDSSIEEMADIAIDLIKETNSNYFENNSENAIRNLIKINIINNL